MNYGKIIVSIIIMIILTIILGYYINSTISLKKYKTNNYHKLYMSIFMGLQMGLIEILMIFWMKGFQYYLIPFSSILIIFTVFTGYKLYTLDFLEDDEQFIKSMIEHHSLALSMTNKIKNKTKNPKLKVIAEDILSSQEKQIKEMYDMIQK